MTSNSNFDQSDSKEAHKDPFNFRNLNQKGHSVLANLNESVEISELKLIGPGEC
jgi:hypothetical protein